MSVPRDPSSAHCAAPDADLLVIGGGINGAGIARDAAGRGLRVVLCERGDLAQGTSSRSSRLIHGGLRYLEYGEFRLVREALREREVLMSLAPHLVRPVRFVLPHVEGMRPAWMLRLGLFAYDHLARRRRLPASSALRLREVPEGAAVREQYRRGFAYADCRADDARLVVLNAVGARERGAQVRLHTDLVEATPEGGTWRARLRSADGTEASLRARAIVNAAGPWVEEVAARIPGVARRRHARLIKGSHLVVPKFWRGEHAYLLQNVDRRVVFVTPYEYDFAMVGTTDIPFDGDPAAASISPEEESYLCDAVNRQLRCALAPRDAVHRFSGVRSLADDAHADPSAVTRDYVIDAPMPRGHPPILTILGGKITTYRRLAEHALALLAPHFPGLPAAWTEAAPLPGGAIEAGDFARAQARFFAAAAFLPAEHARALFDRHGSIAYGLVAGGTAASMGEHLGGGLYECELEHLVRKEWARSAEDILWRRTKVGLRISEAQRARVEDRMRAYGSNSVQS